MRDLRTEAGQFDQRFPDYADGPYGEIASSLAGFGAAVHNLPEGCLEQVLRILKPIILIRNYKAQTPFPPDIVAVIRNMADLANIIVNNPRAEQIVVEGLIGIRGFDLPTVSAIFHFIHPDRFPIVDRNVEAACEVLYEEWVQNDGPLPNGPPRLPYHGMRSANKFARYMQFRQFISTVISVQRGQYQWPDNANDFRVIDKALMVLGSNVLSH